MQGSRCRTVPTILEEEGIETKCGSRGNGTSAPPPAGIYDGPGVSICTMLSWQCSMNINLISVMVDDQYHGIGTMRMVNKAIAYLLIINLPEEIWIGYVHVLIRGMASFLEVGIEEFCGIQRWLVTL